MGRKKLIRLLNQLATEMKDIDELNEFVKALTEDNNLMRGELARMRSKSRGGGNAAFCEVSEAGYSFFSFLDVSGKPCVEVRNSKHATYKRLFNSDKADMAMRLAVECVHYDLGGSNDANQWVANDSDLDNQD